MLRRLVNEGNEKIPGSVCLIAPHANANPTWMADLEWVKQVLSLMGVRVVATLTHKTPLAEIENVSSAEASLLLSHDAGQKAADYLSETWGIEQICRGIPLPIGMTNTERWLTTLGERFDRQKEAERMVAEGERMVTTTCRRKWPMARFFFRTPAAIVADATVGIPLVRFVTEEMEMTPELVALYLLPSPGPRTARGGTARLSGSTRRSCTAPTCTGRGRVSGRYGRRSSSGAPSNGMRARDWEYRMLSNW